MSKHTPGPWFASTTPSGKGKVVDANGFSICNTTAGPYEQQREDARLIAAAPELLAACKALFETIRAHEIESLSCDRDGEAYCDCLRKQADDAAAAIAKAEGGQNE